MKIKNKLILKGREELKVKESILIKLKSIT